MVGIRLPHRVGHLHRRRHAGAGEIEEPRAVVDARRCVLAVLAPHLDRQRPQAFAQHGGRSVDATGQRHQACTRPGTTVGRALDHAELGEDAERASGGRTRQTRAPAELAHPYWTACGDDQLQQRERPMDRAFWA